MFLGFFNNNFIVFYFVLFQRAVTYQGDNFVRYSGDTQKMAKTQCKCFSLSFLFWPLTYASKI